MYKIKNTNASKQTAVHLHRKAGLYISIVIVFLPILASCGRTADPAPVVEITVSNQEQSVADLTSSTQNSAPPATGIDLNVFDPCGLLTADEFETFFGEPAAPGAVPETIGFYRSCMVWNQSGNKFITLQLAHQTAEAFKAELETSAAMLDLELLPVEGLGDEAVYFSGLLHVRVGETVLQVLTWYQDLDQALAVSKEIAGLALPRLH